MKWAKNDTKQWAGSGERCFHSHPPLPIEGHDKVHVYGGNCGKPVVTDADIYVGLDWSMAEHRQRLPWVAGEAIHYRIEDRHAPSDAAEFLELVEYLCDQANGGSKIHIGCIGGHGRTGIVLSAMVALMTDEPDPIGYVRAHYCKKVVETKEQIDFLMEHYHCKEVAPSKSFTVTKGKKGKVVGGIHVEDVRPMSAKHYLWGTNEVDTN